MNPKPLRNRMVPSWIANPHDAHEALTAACATVLSTRAAFDALMGVVGDGLMALDRADPETCRRLLKHAADTYAMHAATREVDSFLQRTGGVQ